MRTITEPVTEASPQLTSTIRKSTFGVALVSVFLAIGANAIHLEGKTSPEAQISARGQRQDFDIAIATDEQDQPGLSTLIMAGSNGLLFDCGLVRGETAPSVVTAVFLTHLQTTTADGLDRAGGAACTAPSIRIWGPPGTRQSMLQMPFNQELQDWQRRPFTVIDVQEGVVSETGNVVVAAIETAPSRLAYRVGFEGRSVLIASDVSYSDHLVARSAGVDMVVLRHTDLTDTIRLLQRIKPRLAVLSPDGKPLNVAQIREHYAGAIQLFSAGAHRIHVLDSLSLDNDIK
jgi:hypothetical protein